MTYSNENYVVVMSHLMMMKLLLITIKFKVAVESQPTELVVTNVYVPLSVYVTPFQEKTITSCCSISDEELLLMVKFKVAVCVQPDSLVDSKV